MMDYSWVFKVAGGSSHLRDQFAFLLQWTTVVPWGVVSWFTSILGISTASHLVLVSFIRLVTVHLIIYWLFRHRHSFGIAYLLSSAIVLLPPIRLAQNYSHWWAHIVLFVGLWILTLDTRLSYRQWKCLVVVLLLATLSVWTNLPHLITAWLGLALGLAQRRLECEPHFEKRRLKFLMTSASCIYLLPLITTVLSLRVFGDGARETLFIFGNQSISKVIQGFGGWWYFDSWCVKPNECFLYELTNIRHFEGFRFAIRILFFVAVIFNLLSTRRILETRNGAQHRGFTSATALGILMIPLLMLSLLGGSSTYRSLLSALPLTFSAIREPFAKFGAPFLICLYFSLGSLFTFKHRSTNRIAVSGLMLAVAWLSIPELTRNNQASRDYYSGLRPLSWAEWSELDQAVTYLGQTSEKLCVVGPVDPRNRIIRARLGLEFPEKFTDLNVLRPLSINDAARSNGIELDRTSFCGNPDATIVNIDGKSRQFESNSKSGLPCPGLTTPMFQVYPPDCVARLRFYSEDKFLDQYVPVGSSWTRVDQEGVLAFRYELTPRLRLIDEHKGFGDVKIRIRYFSRKNPRGDLSNVKEATLSVSEGGSIRVSTTMNCIELNDECWYVIHSIEVSR